MLTLSQSDISNKCNGKRFSKEEMDIVLLNLHVLTILFH
jgi:hypothetical protein